jgi:hypothetical protein
MYTANVRFTRDVATISLYHAEVWFGGVEIFNYSNSPNQKKKTDAAFISVFRSPLHWKSFKRALRNPRIPMFWDFGEMNAFPKHFLSGRSIATYLDEFEEPQNRDIF